MGRLWVLCQGEGGGLGPGSCGGLLGHQGDCGGVAVDGQLRLDGFLGDAQVVVGMSMANGQVGRHVVELAVGEKINGSPLDDPNAGKNPHAVALGKLGGLRGGNARAANLGAQKLKAIGKKAAEARRGTKPEEKAATKKSGKGAPAIKKALTMKTASLHSILSRTMAPRPPRFFSTSSMCWCWRVPM